MSKLESYISEAIDNIRNDRKVTKALLDDLIQYMAKEESRHRDVGLTAAKYLETLQRSNEQLVKVSGIVAKKTTSSGLTADDKEEIYDILKGEQ
jgi:phage-related minor tail protein|tara:strand:+ start:177 stop:458 length:282 start_codon:yes stop_codon:yes gene_type:complete